MIMHQYKLMHRVQENRITVLVAAEKGSEKAAIKKAIEQHAKVLMAKNNLASSWKVLSKSEINTLQNVNDEIPKQPKAKSKRLMRSQ